MDVLATVLFLSRENIVLLTTPVSAQTSAAIKRSPKSLPERLKNIADNPFADWRINWFDQIISSIIYQDLFYVFIRFVQKFYRLVCNEYGINKSFFSKRKNCTRCKSIAFAASTNIFYK